MTQSSKRKYVVGVDLITLSNDENELLDLLSEVHGRLAIAENNVKLHRRERDLVEAKLKKIRFEKQRTQISITDHAVVRYIERVIGGDIDALKNKMIAKLPDDYGRNDEIIFVKIDVDGLQYVIRDNIIISVVPIGDKDVKTTNA